MVYKVTSAGLAAALTIAVLPLGWACEGGPPAHEPTVTILTERDGGAQFDAGLPPEAGPLDAPRVPFDSGVAGDDEDEDMSGDGGLVASGDTQGVHFEIQKLDVAQDTQKAAVEKSLKSHFRQMAACVGKIDDDPHREVTVLMEFSIGLSGKPGRIDGLDPSDPTHVCILNNVTNIVFPPPDAIMKVKATILVKRQSK